METKALVLLSGGFQFQYGAIKRKMDGWYITRIIRCFNSNMVRLKDGFRIIVMQRLHEFQFQYGAIKR